MCEKQGNGGGGGGAGGFLWLRLTVSRPKGPLGEREVQAVMGRCRFDLDTDQRRLEGCMWCLCSKEESHAIPSI